MGKTKFCEKCGSEFESAGDDRICFVCQTGGEKSSAKPESGPEPAEPARVSRSEDVPVRVLVVDDEIEYCEMARKRFEAAGYQVSMASNGKEALLKVKDERPDLIVTDVLMPKMTGYDFLKTLKQETGPVSKIPIIITSGKMSMKGYFEESRHVRFIEKSLGLDYLFKEAAGMIKKDSI